MGEPLETAILVSPFLSSCPLPQSYILPCVDYCNVVWDCCSKQDSNHLQTLLNYGCRTVLHHPRLSSSSALWKDLGLSSLASHRKLHLAEFMFKCHNFIAPPYLTSRFNTTSHKYYTCMRNLVNLPPVKSSYGQCSFSFLGVSLPSTLYPCLSIMGNHRYCCT